MKSEVKVFTRENGEIQRVQSVHLDGWSQLNFFALKQETLEQQKQALQCFADIYENYLVPACPWIFSKMVLFCLPKEIDIRKYLSENTQDFVNESKYYGKVADPLTIATILLQEGVKLKGKTPVFKTAVAEKLYRDLEAYNCIRIVCGKLPKTQMIPVSRFAGHMSEVLPEAKVKVNANFFIMDPIDCATVFDQVGTPFGLCVKDGVVEHPPLFNREALLVEKDGAAYISKKDIRELMIEINDRTYLSGKKCNHLYTTRKGENTRRKRAFGGYYWPPCCCGKRRRKY